MEYFIVDAFRGSKAIIQVYNDDINANGNSLQVKHPLGNPAGVVLLGESNFPDVELMQYIAQEINLSETAFVRNLTQEGNFHIRWFTPHSEAPICGHASMASAAALHHISNRPQKHSDTNNNAVKTSATKHIKVASSSAANDSLEIWPNTTYNMCYGDVSKSGNALQKIAITVSKDGTFDMKMPSFLPTQIYKLKHNHFAGYKVNESLRAYNNCVLIEMQNAEDVINFKPDFAKIEKEDCRAIIITAQTKHCFEASRHNTVSAKECHTQHNTKYDFISRYFAPKVGIPEDPVCCSAHCSLVPYWFKRLNKEPAQTLHAFQASKRGGHILCKQTPENVVLNGSCAIVAQGKLQNLPNVTKREHDTFIQVG